MICKRLTKSCSSITLVLAHLKAQNLQVLHNHRSHHQVHQRLKQNQKRKPRQNYVVENTNGKLENGYLTSSLRMGITGAAIVFIPKGVTLPTVQGFVDGSDNTKDRILITQSASPQSDAKQFYYKAD